VLHSNDRLLRAPPTTYGRPKHDHSTLTSDALDASDAVFRRTPGRIESHGLAGCRIVFLSKMQQISTAYVPVFNYLQMCVEYVYMPRLLSFNVSNYKRVYSVCTRITISVIIGNRKRSFIDI